MNPQELIAKMKQSAADAEARAADITFEKAKDASKNSLMFGATTRVQKTKNGAIVKIKRNNV